MSKFHRRVIVLVLSVFFSSPLIADDGFEASVWQEIWENLITIISGSDKEGGSVYVPSGIVREGDGGGDSGNGDNGGSVYVPSGLTGGPQQPNEGGSVYVPSG